MRIAIMGSRTFTNYPVLKMSLFLVFGLLTHYTLHNTAIFNSGAAKGADKLGERFAHEIGRPIKYFKPDWDNLGKSAGMRRNIEMSDESDIVVAFWDFQSRGSAQMIDYSKKQNKIVFVFDFEGNLKERYEHGEKLS